MNHLITFSKLLIASLFLMVLSSSFVGFSDLYDTQEIEGYWVYKSYKEGAYTYTKRTDFKNNKMGFKFTRDGKMTKRMDPDWCVRVAGPYTNLEGSYEFIDEKTIRTKYQCPISDKPSFNKYEIIDLTSKKMVLKSLPIK